MVFVEFQEARRFLLLVSEVSQILLNGKPSGSDQLYSSEYPAHATFEFRVASPTSTSFSIGQRCSSSSAVGVDF